jgi:hypothetical protein
VFSVVLHLQVAAQEARQQQEITEVLVAVVILGKEEARGIHHQQAQAKAIMVVLVELFRRLIRQAVEVAQVEQELLVTAEQVHQVLEAQEPYLVFQDRL